MACNVHIHTPIYVCMSVYTCALAVYLKRSFHIGEALQLQILWTNLFSHAQDFSLHRERLCCPWENICHLLEISLRRAMYTFLFMLGSFLLTEANIIQQAQNYGIVLHRSSCAETMATSFSLAARSLLEPNDRFWAFHFFFLLIHMSTSIYSQVTNSLRLTFCIHCPFVKNHGLLHHLKF